MPALGDLAHAPASLRGEPCGQLEKGGLTEIKHCGFWYDTVGGRRVDVAPRQV